MAMANTNGGKTTGKKLTKDQAKLAQVVQRVGAVDKKPAKAGKAPLRPGSKGTTMVKQEVPFGGIGKAVVKGAVSVAKKVVAKDAVKTADKFASKMAVAKTPAQKAKVVVSKAKADAKVEKNALKAANKPTSKNNASVGPKTSAYVSDSVKNMKPANPNVTRGGSMKSKLNWPDSMTKPKGK